VIAAGGTPAQAQAAAERACAEGAAALLSFGLAGGLDPALAAGALVIPHWVVNGPARYPVADALLAWLGGATTEAIAAAGATVAPAAAKALLWRSSGAAAVDLESGAVAAVARRHGRPFAVLRAICDPAWRDLPPAALVALDGAGAIGLWRVAGSVLARPSQIPGLLALAGDAARARASLIRRVGELGGRTLML